MPRNKQIDQDQPRGEVGSGESTPSRTPPTKGMGRGGAGGGTTRNSNRSGGSASKVSSPNRSGGSSSPRSSGRASRSQAQQNVRTSANIGMGLGKADKSGGTQ